MQSEVLLIPMMMIALVAVLVLGFFLWGVIVFRDSGSPGRACPAPSPFL